MVKLNPANFVFHTEFTYNKILREGSYTKPEGVTGTYTLTTGLQPWTRWDIRQRLRTDNRIYATDRQSSFMRKSYLINRVIYRQYKI